MRFALMVAVFSTLAVSVAARAEHPLTTIAAVQATGDLPDGEGRKILQASCTACHELTEVTKFKGYYTRDEWRDVIKTMIEYGAQIKPADVDILVDYLDKNLGKQKERYGSSAVMLRFGDGPTLIRATSFIVDTSITVTEALGSVAM